MNKLFLTWGASFGFLTVAIGAFGAHALQPLLIENGRVDTFDTAILYLSIHALALLVIGIIAERVDSKLITYSGYSMIVGAIVFSGSLMALSVTDIRLLGAITPIGGVLLIAGWVFLIWGIIKSK